MTRFVRISLWAVIPSLAVAASIVTIGLITRGRWWPSDPTVTVTLDGRPESATLHCSTDGPCLLCLDTPDGVAFVVNMRKREAHWAYPNDYWFILGRLFLRRTSPHALNGYSTAFHSVPGGVAFQIEVGGVPPLKGPVYGTYVVRAKSLSESLAPRL